MITAICLQFFPVFNFSHIHFISATKTKAIPDRRNGLQVRRGCLLTTLSLARGAGKAVSLNKIPPTPPLRKGGSKGTISHINNPSSPFAKGGSRGILTRNTT